MTDFQKERDVKHRVLECRYCGRKFTRPQQFRIEIGVEGYGVKLFNYSCRWRCLPERSDP